MAKTTTVKQITFAWEGLNKQGMQVKGESTAASMAAVKADLRKQGILPKKVRKKPAPLFGEKKIVPKDIALFARQMATMMQSGIPLTQAFDIVGKGHSKASMQKLIMNIKNDVEAGSTFADALTKHPLYFDDLFCNLVQAGEQSGALENLLDKIATYKEKTEALKAKIKKALTYPIAVIAIAFIVTAILLIFVVPVFAEMFSDFGADLPALTQFVVTLSDFFVDWYLVIFGSIILAVGGFFQAKKRSKGFNEFIDRTALKVPAVGDLVRKSAIARFSSTLSTMFAAGVPLVEAMTTVAGAAGNVVYSNAILRMRDEVATGMSLQMAMRQSGLFPNMVVQLVAIGEEAGSRFFGDYSLITAPYGDGARNLGVLGVIGPTRMAYDRVIPIVDVTSRMLSAALKS